MKNISEGLSTILADGLKKELKEDEYLNDGVPYCKKCHTPRAYYWAEKGVMLKCVCDCQEKQLIFEKNKKREKERVNQFKPLESLSIISEEYKSVTFGSVDMDRDESFIKARTKCMNYTMREEEMLENGYGIYLFGSVGTGKTLLLACMAKAIKRPCLVTKLNIILDAIRNTYNDNSNITESDIMKLLTSIDFLFIDDIGEENYTKNNGDNFTQNILEQLINDRKLKKLPTCFSSNYSIGSLSSRGISERTIDRIAGVTNATIELKGSSYRLIQRKGLEL